MKFFKSAVLAFGMLLFAHGATFAQTDPDARAGAARPSPISRESVPAW